MHQIIAFIMSLFFGISSPAPLPASHSTQTPTAPISEIYQPAANPALKTRVEVHPEAPTVVPVAFKQLQAKEVRAYFGHTLERSGQKIDALEKTNYLVDLEKLRASYAPSEAPLGDRAFAEYLQRVESKDDTIVQHLGHADSTLDEIIAGNLANYAGQITGFKPVPWTNQIRSYMNVKSICQAMSSAGRSVLNGAVFTLMITFLPEFARSLFATMISPTNSLLYSVGQRVFGPIMMPYNVAVNRFNMWLESRGQRAHAPLMKRGLNFRWVKRSLKKSRLRAEALDAVEDKKLDELDEAVLEGLENEMLELDHLHGGTREELDTFLKKQLLDIFVLYHTTKASLLTGEARDGLESFTSNIHWREGAQVNLIGGIDTNASIHKVDRKLSTMLALRLINQDMETQRRAAELAENLLEEHAAMWKGRLHVDTAVQQTPRFEQLYLDLRRLGLRDQDLTEMLKEHKTEVVGRERIAGGLIMQIIQDAAYGEHNRRLPPKLRKFQGELRKLFNMGEFYDEHREAIERGFKSIGATITVSRQAGRTGIDLNDGKGMVFNLSSDKVKKDYMTVVRDHCERSLRAEKSAENENTVRPMEAAE